MRRAARRDIKIGSELRNFAHEPDKAAMAPASEVRFALILDRPAHFVAASQAVDLGTMFSQPREEVRKIFQLLGDHVDDA
jgi:hypothetical protein